MTTLNPWAPTGVCSRPPVTTPAAKSNVPTVAIHARMGVTLLEEVRSVLD
jgi:hypothetical protein